MNKALTTLFTLAISTQVSVAASKPQAKNKQVASRRPASTSNIRSYAETQSAPKNWQARVGLLGGFAKLNSSDGTEQTAREAGSVNNTIYGGINADVTIMKYVGVELEGFYGQGNSSTSTKPDFFAGKVTTTERKLKQYGGMLDVGGRYTTTLGSIKLIPRGGLGFGLLDLQNGVTDSKLTGIYATAGLEVHLLPELYLSADYARSLTANGTADDGTKSTDVDSANFDRIRAGAYYRVTNQFTVGTQYVRRTLSTTATPGATETTETSNQFLGAFLVNF